MIVDFQRKFGFTAVMISHEIPEIFYFCQRIVMLNEGRICFEGTPEGVRQFPDPIVRRRFSQKRNPKTACIMNLS
jgi:phospholipid/cholesterol/gamma-HCH transport system ATP-binding protein